MAAGISCHGVSLGGHETYPPIRVLTSPPTSAAGACSRVPSKREG